MCAAENRKETWRQLAQEIVNEKDRNTILEKAQKLIELLDDYLEKERASGPRKDKR